MKTQLLLLLFCSVFVTDVLAAKCPEPEVIAPCYCITTGNIYCRGDVLYSLKGILKTLSDSLDPSDKHYGEIHIENTVTGVLEDSVFGEITFDRLYIEAAHNLSKISTTAFKGQTKVTRIHFIYTPIQNNPPDFDIFQAMSYLPDLELVDILYTNINSLPSNSFSIKGSQPNGYRNLISVEIRGSLQSIGNYAFNNLDNLQHINLQHNSIDYIGQNAFHFDSVSTKKLDIELSNNTLNETSFALGAFANVNRPYKVWLRYNPRLTSLPENIFGPVLESGNELHLLETPVVCDCKLWWLYKKRTDYAKLVSEAYCSGDKRPVFDAERTNFNNCG